MKNSLYESLYRKIANDIRTGKLKPGTRLSSVRRYAEENALSVNTVLGAYNLLLAEGYISSKDRSGYYVCQLEQTVPELPRKKKQEDKEKKEEDKRPLNLSSNLVDSTLFPYSTLRQLYRETLSGSNIKLLEHSGSFLGDEDLRKSVAQYVYSSKGIECSYTQVVIGNGSASHLEKLARLFENDATFIMEDPGFPSTYEIVKDTGKQILKVSVDDEGASINDIRKVSENIENETALLHISPSHQFPLGSTMTAPRRTAILKWATESQNRYIIEDDYDSEFRYNSRPISALYSMDDRQKVIYLGTFSRTLTPSLRISFMILPPHLVKRYEKAFSLYPCPVSRIDQKVVSLFIDGSYFERHIRCMRRVYKQKRNTMLGIIKATFPEARIKGEEAGLHFIVYFPIEEQNLIEMARKDNMILNGTGTGAVIIGYAHLSEDDMQRTRLFLQKIRDLEKK